MKRSVHGALAALCVTCASGVASAQAVTATAQSCGATPDAQAQRGWQELSRGHWVVAEACLRAVLGASRDRWVRRHRRQLGVSMRVVTAHVGGLRIDGGVPGARVLVDGEEVARLPMTEPVRVVAAAVTVRIERDGYRAGERRVTIAAGALPTVETIPIEPLPPAPTPPPAAVVEPPPRVVDASVPLVVTPPPTVLPPPVEASPRGGQTVRTLAWVSAGGAVAFAGIGVVATVLGQPAADRWNDANQCGASTGDGSDACSNDLRTAQTMEVLRWTGIVGAGVLVVTSAVLFVASSRGEAHAHAAFGCGAGPGTLGLACGGSF